MEEVDNYDWLSKFHSFYVAAAVGIISRHGLSIVAHYENQPNKHRLALYMYKLSIHLHSHLNSCT